MRTVKGRTDHVVVIGAGLAGLSAALRLAGSGRRVTMLERQSVPGGRAGVIADGGYRFDNGPTVLTMPDLIADAFDCVGEDMSDWLTLRPIDPLYRAWYADGSSLDVKSDPAAMVEEIRRVCGPDEASGYERYVEFVTELYRYEMADFIDRNIDSPFDLLTPNLARLAGLGGFRRMAPKVEQYLKDPRTQRVLSFQAMYAGMSPFDALALYCVIAYMDSVAGVYAPDGGMHAVPEAMAAAATKHGVDIRYSTDAVHIERRGARAVAVHTGDGERIPCDAVVVNPDLPVAMRELMGEEPWSVRRLRYSPSCFLMLAGSSQSYSKVVHHNIHFGRSWRGVFDELIDRGELMSDPSFLVSNPDALRPITRSRRTRDLLRLLPHTEHVSRHRLGPGTRGIPRPRPLDPGGARLCRLRRRHRGRTHHRPHGLGASGHGRRLTLRVGPLVPANRTVPPQELWGDNIVFAGSGTTPGVGVPMVLISGRLAAERITGPDPSYRSRAMR